MVTSVLVEGVRDDSIIGRGRNKQVECVKKQVMCTWEENKVDGKTEKGIVILIWWVNQSWLKEGWVGFLSVDQKQRLEKQAT